MFPTRYMRTISNNRFLLMRHGQSIWNHDSKFTGWTNIPLTEKGVLEAKNVAQMIQKNNLKPDIIFTSVMERAIKTSDVIKDELGDRMRNIMAH